MTTLQKIGEIIDKVKKGKTELRRREDLVSARSA